MHQSKILISDTGIVMKFVVLFLLCVSVSGNVEVRCIEREREALLSFKNGLLDESGILSSWRSDDCCKWYGVVCSNTTSHVIRLELGTDDHSDGVLAGTISSSLLELHHLTHLHLSHNDFGGVRIPEFIGTMKQLQHLYLLGCNFSGIIPPQLGNLTSLHTLDLSSNYLISENLNWLSGLSLLSYLDLSHSNLNDTNWLQQILKLPSLQELHLRSCNLKDVKSLTGLFVNSSSTSLSILDLSENLLTSSVFDWLFNVSMDIVSIDLSWNALGGPIPNSFERFKHLEIVDLSKNMLEGDILNSFGNLSHLKVLGMFSNKLRGRLDEVIPNLGLLPALQILDLAENQFDGPIPDLTVFSALTQVYLGSNNLTGFVPPSIGQLPKLRILEVSANHLEGVVSESHLNKLVNLKTLDLSLNSLTLHIAPDWNPPFQLEIILLGGCNVGPSFPKWIQTQKNLVDLDLSSAGISDEVPNWLWSLESLDRLLLSDNQINGTLPDLTSIFITDIDVSSNKITGSIPSFHPNTVTLQLSQNMFFGSISSSICEFHHDKLEFLDLSNNQLTGELPNCWEKMPELSFLSLANNSFLGKMPHSLGSLPELVILRLGYNNLSGELPSTWKFCQQLNMIDVGGNQLTGEIPSWIGQTYTMRFLNLHSNRLHGGIPPQICNLTRIHTLDISRNKLTGTIPDCFNKFVGPEDPQKFGFYLKFYYDSVVSNYKLMKFYYGYSSFQWKGQELVYKRNLVLLTLIDFSSNRLIGSIPQSFASMIALSSLNLSRNSLTGPIIPNIGQMEMLESLDLSNNQLYGEIPKSLANLSFLAVLDLSNNNLSGKIPSSTQLQSFNTASYAGNDGLCGRPLPLCPGDRLTPPTTTHEEKDDGFWMVQGFIISMVFGFIVGFWGVVGSLILKKSWRYAYCNLLGRIGDWFYVRTTIFLSKWRPN